MKRLSDVDAVKPKFCSLNSTTVPKVWQDISRPKAQAIFDTCVGGGVNQKKHDIPNVVNQTVGHGNEEGVLKMLLQSRELRIEPPLRRAEGVTGVKLLRAQLRAGEGRIGLRFSR